MKGRQHTPLWLICDVPAFLRLHIALGILALAVQRFWPRHRPPTPEGIVWLTLWQAGCEALLRWAIARQAFRLCGLDPKLARIQLASEAKDSFSWYARNRTFLDMYDSMTAIARRWARRIRAAMAKTACLAPVVAPPPRRLAASSPRRLAVFRKCFAPRRPRPPASASVRRPGALLILSRAAGASRRTDCRLPTAHCLAAIICEVAGV
jgi:hypothetical protein